MQINIAPIALFLLSFGIIEYSCGNSIHIILPDNSKLRPALIDVSDGVGEVTGYSIITMVCTSSITLVVLYFFSENIMFLLKILLTFSYAVATVFVLWDWLYFIYPKPVSSIISYIISGILVLIWFSTEHWIVMNFISFSTCVFGIYVIKIKKVIIVLLISAAFLIYDVWWVFLSPSVFGESVMVETAQNIVPHIPAAFVIPSGDHFSLIGVGDVVLPGFILDFFLRFDCMRNTYSFEFASLGYAIGVLITYIMVEVMKCGQPALLWIFPSILICTFSYIGYIGAIRDLWNFSSEEYENVINTEENVIKAELEKNPSDILKNDS